MSDKPAKPVDEGKSSDKVIIPAPSRQITPELAQTVEFTLARLEISGNSSISSETFVPYYENLIGQKIKLARIFGVANEITKALPAPAVGEHVRELLLTQLHLDATASRGEAA